jgi:hypothetical protein
MDLLHPPRITFPSYNQILYDQRSPIYLEAGVCYQHCLDREIDPAIPLALAGALTGYGTAEAARACRSWALLDYPFQVLRAPSRSETRNLPVYLSWHDGLSDLLDYFDHKRYTTLDHLIASYTPLADRPDAPDRVRALIARWESLP